MATMDDVRRDLFVAGLIDLHTVEHQALSIMRPQVARIRHHAELVDRLRRHIEETEAQIDRIDHILSCMGAPGPTIGNAALHVSGTLSAIVHMAAGDEILKDCFANFAFEHFEIASYSSLIVLAAEGGFDEAIAPLNRSLVEERSMAQWLSYALPAITRRHADRQVDGGRYQAKVRYAQ